MKLLILALLASSLFAWECSVSKENSTLTTDAFCRNYTAVITVVNYDRFSIKTGIRVVTEDDSDDILKLIIKEADQCYQTCIMANMY